MGEPQPAEWIGELGPAVPLEWQSHGDEWLHHLMKALSELVDLGGHSRYPREPDERLPLPHIAITPTASSVTSSLRLVLLDGAVLPLVTGAHPFDEGGQVEPWRRAVEIANERLGNFTEVFAWDAIIGPAPGLGLMDGNVALASSAHVGTLSLEPAGTHFSETVPSRMPSLFSRSGFGSWPVIVSGEASGFNWYVAGASASKELRRLCGMLSVAWDMPWTLRQAPRHPITNAWAVPAVSPWERDQSRIVPGVPARTIHVPEWADRAWDVLERDKTMRAAVAAHLEGWLMLETHPSFALIAFVGAVEAIGALLSPLERCKTCGTVIGSARRFKEAIALVRSGDDLKELSGLYTSRSTTAHSGHLHGPEIVFDFIDYPAAFGIDPAWDFAYRQVFRMQKACRDLLELALIGDLPTI